MAILAAFGESDRARDVRAVLREGTCRARLRRRDDAHRATSDDILFLRLRSFFTDDVIVDLTALIALQNASSRFNAALRRDAERFSPGVVAAERRDR